MTVDLMERLSKITTIPSATFDKLSDIITCLVSDAVEECILAKDDKCEMNVGIGTLTIFLSENEIKYKFVPNAKFEESLTNTVVNGQNLLTVTVEDVLKERLTHIYKDLI
jgi:hypothetical protein